MSARPASVVLVTGVSSGIGRELVLELLRRGHAVSGCARRAARLEELSAAVGLERERLLLAPADVNDAAACSRWIEETIRRFGRIDAIVHNAGYGQMGPFDALTVDDFRVQFETNFFAVVRLTREVLPRLVAAGGGDVVLISSILGHLGLPGRAPYCASKWALEGFAESIRPELRVRGVRVSVINPGFTETEFPEAIRASGARPPRGVTKGMTAAKVARVVAGTLGRTRRNVFLTGLGRLALHVKAWAPALLDRAVERNFRRELEAQGFASPRAGKPDQGP